MNDRERELWVNNDEGLYTWWRTARKPMRQFIRDNREYLTEFIEDKLTRKINPWERPDFGTRLL